MSLETAIQQNTAAINALIEILSKGASPAPVANVTIETAEDPAPKAKRTKKEAAPAATAGEPASSEQPAQSPETGASDASETEAAAAPAETKQVTYTEASAAVVNVANTKGRAAAVGILAKFGAKTLGEVKASSYGKVIAECEAVL